MKSVVFLLALFLLFASVFSQVLNEECKQLLRNADGCVRKIFYVGDPDIKLIRTNDDLTQHCREIKSAYTCMMKYGKCVTLAQKEIFSSFSRSAKKSIKKRCETSSGRKEFLKHALCVRKPEVYEMNKCVDKMLLEMKYISENMDGPRILETTCCSFQSSLKCLRDKADEYCTSVTGAATGKYLSKTAGQFTGEIVELFCGERNSVAQCNRLEPEWMKNLPTIAGPFSQIQPQRKGFTDIMLKIVTKSLADGALTSSFGR